MDAASPFLHFGTIPGERAGRGRRDDGIDSHEGLRHYGLYDTVVAVEAEG